MTKLSKTELRLLEQLANGNNRIKNIAKALKKSTKQIYRISKKLSDKGFISVSKSVLKPAEKIHVNLLLNILAEFPNLTEVLADSGINILTVLQTPKTIREITKKTKIKKSIIYKKLKQTINISIIKKQDKHYVLNKKLWKKLREFLINLKKYQETIDSRVQPDSIIYHKTDKEIVFSSKSEQDASLTAFSAYNLYGIKLLLPTNYYYLPKKKLTKKQVFQHSLYVAEKEKIARYLIYTALFYLKFKKELSRTSHNILKSIKKIIAGKKINNYPSLNEIKEKAKLYDIRL